MEMRLSLLFYISAQFHLSSLNLKAIQFKWYNMQGHVCTFVIKLDIWYKYTIPGGGDGYRNKMETFVNGK